jgi:hypothetical protein
MIDLFAHFMAWAILIAPLAAFCCVLVVWIESRHRDTFRFTSHECADGKVRLVRVEKLEDK